MAVMKRTLLVLLVLFALPAGAEEMVALMARTITPPEDVKVLISSRCQPCHYELRIKPSLLLNTNKWFRLTGEKFEVERRVFLEEPPHSMPMGSLLDAGERRMLQEWFNRLHQEL